jgi:hypothetical protein
MMIESREADLLVNLVNFANLVRNFLFYQRNLMGEKSSHKIDKVAGDGTPSMKKDDGNENLYGPDKTCQR